MMQKPAPTSPFWIYKWRYTFLNPSVIHRASGLIQVLGLLALTYFLVALSSGSRSYSNAMTILGHPVFKIFWVVLIWSFCFHLLAGIRHLVLDTGRGLERRQARLTAKLVVIGSVLLTLVVSLLVFWLPGG